MRLCDVQLSLPYLLFVVAIVGVLGPSLRNVVLVFGIADFPLFARMTRGETLRLRAAPFVESAVVGIRKPDPRIYRHACDLLGVAPEQCIYLDTTGASRI
jgi:HAD superfamily hydrolase (TIGR01509 family)